MKFRAWCSRSSYTLIDAGALLSNDRVSPLATWSLWVSAVQVCLQIFSARLDPHRASFHSATQYWDTHRCPSHCNQLSRGTPLTRYWFMPALNTQRFATVLTHQLTCYSHAEYHFCATVYQSDVQSKLQSVCNEILKFRAHNLRKIPGGVLIG